jgi:hypothetical protein
MAGFIWRYNISGGRPLILNFLMKDTETLTQGDLLNIEVGEVDLAATNDTDFAGVMVGPEDPDDATAGQPGKVAGTDSTTLVKCIVNPDAVYGVADANARAAGATLDIAGATGAQGVAASANVDVVVVERKRQSSDETRVILSRANHYLTRQ